MAEMKDSGVAWINTIPKEWEIKKIKYILKNRNENNNPIRSRNILSLTAKQGVVPHEEKEGGGNKPKEDYSAYKLAYPNDIVMNSMNVLSGSVGLSKYFGCVSPVYYMLSPINEKDDVRYYNYIFQTTVFQRSLLGLGNGILMKESDNGKLKTIRMRIPLDKLGNLLIPVPDNSIQRKIADYLDSIIPNIDMLLSDIEKQIATLEEYKKSIIIETVTKGLDSDVEMKDSGIEWIGKIPSHWKLSKVKYHVKIENGTDPKKDGDIPVYGSGADSFKTCGEYKIGPTVLLGRKGATLHIPHYIEGKYWNVDTAFNVIVDNSINLLFFYYLACCFDYKYYISQTTLPGMTQTNYGNMYIPLPKMEEQNKINEYLKTKCLEIENAIEGKKKQLETLEQYKKSLIYEYVTGKKEVK